MDYKINFDGQDTVLSGVKYFSLAQVLDCGQCFRWSGDSTRFEGIAHGRRMVLELRAKKLIIKNTAREEFDAVWADYFDLNRDYGALHALFSRDEVLARACKFAPGLRLMRQEPWETLISFILSQNANIPRIKAMLQKLCENFGAKPEGEQGGHSFPTPEILARLSADDLAPVRSGYRAEYILDAARRVAGGSLDLAALKKMPADQAAAELLKIHGVGPKVADCVLLYGLGKTERYPMDTWMKKAMTKYFPDGFPEYLRDVAGIAQQFLFHYVRNHP